MHQRQQEQGAGALAGLGLVQPARQQINPDPQLILIGYPHAQFDQPVVQQFSAKANVVTHGAFTEPTAAAQCRLIQPLSQALADQAHCPRHGRSGTSDFAAESRQHRLPRLGVMIDDIHNLCFRFFYRGSRRRRLTAQPVVGEIEQCPAQEGPELATTALVIATQGGLPGRALVASLAQRLFEFEEELLDDILRALTVETKGLEQQVQTWIDVILGKAHRLTCSAIRRNEGDTGPGLGLFPGPRALDLPVSIREQVETTLGLGNAVDRRQAQPALGRRAIGRYAVTRGKDHTEVELGFTHSGFSRAGAPACRCRRIDGNAITARAMQQSEAECRTRMAGLGSGAQPRDSLFAPQRIRCGKQSFGQTPTRTEMTGRSAAHEERFTLRATGVVTDRQQLHGRSEISVEIHITGMYVLSGVHMLSFSVPHHQRMGTLSPSVWPSPYVDGLIGTDEHDSPAMPRMRISPLISRTGLCYAVLACLALIPLAAAEHRIDDVYVTAEWRSSAFAYDWEDTTATRHNDDHYQKAYAIGGGWRWGWGSSGSPHHLIAGLGGLGLREEFSGGNVTGGLLRLEAGYGIGIADRFLLTAMPVVDLGLARTSLTVDRGTPLILTGTVIEYGVRTGLRWTPSSTWALSADIGWIAGRERASGEDVNLSVQRSGPLAALSIEWRLDDRPRPLE